MKLSRDKISLIIANLIPLIGVAFFDWSLFNFLFLYWLESAIIGFYFILKMIRIARFRGGAYGAMLIGQSIFFVFHFGGFMIGHFVFILAISQMYQSITAFNLLGLFLLLFSLIVMFISHGISYRQNFIEKKEYEQFSGIMFFSAPYKRIVVMHLVVLFGSVLVMVFNLPLYIVVILKIAVDYWAHIKEHEIKEELAPVNKIFTQLGEDLSSDNIVAMSNKEYSKIFTKNFSKISKDKNV